MRAWSFNIRKEDGKYAYHEFMPTKDEDGGFDVSYDEKTGRYNEPIGTALYVQPLPAKAGYAIVAEGDKWVYVPDNRRKSYWLDGKKCVMNDIGDFPDGYSESPPLPNNEHFAAAFRNEMRSRYDTIDYDLGDGVATYEVSDDVHTALISVKLEGDDAGWSDDEPMQWEDIDRIAHSTTFGTFKQFLRDTMALMREKRAKNNDFQHNTLPALSDDERRNFDAKAHVDKALNKKNNNRGRGRG